MGGGQGVMSQEQQREMYRYWMRDAEDVMMI